MTTVAVTGAARGIGFALVQRLSKRGDTVYAIVRKQTDFARFASLKNVHPVLMDVASTSSVEEGFATIDSLLAGKRLDAVVNSAGISNPGAIETTPMAEFENTLNTNTLGSLRVYRQALPRLRGHGGRMIFVTSLWGRASGPMLSAYCMSKHAIESLADSARMESKDMNVHVIVVEPGTVRTDMYQGQGPHTKALLDALRPEQAALYGNLHKAYLNLVGGPGGQGVPGYGISADECAADIEHAIFDPKPQTRYQSGEDSKAICALARTQSDLEMDAMFLNRFKESLGA